MFKTGDIVLIPLNCPMTKKYFGKFKPQKKGLLGKKAYVQRVEGDKIVVSAIYSDSTPYGAYWHFHALDLMSANQEKVPPVKIKIEVQKFDPDNLVT